MLTSMVLALGGAALGAPQVSIAAPTTYMDGAPFVVRFEVVAPDDGASVPAWAFTASAFTLDGKPLADARDKAMVELQPNQKVATELDLAPLLARSKPELGKPLSLAYAAEVAPTTALAVTYAKLAEKGLDFMKMPVEDLTKFHVHMETNRGPMAMEFWPDVAPNHVRNFLDLSYTGFYDGTLFHRVGPNFMIQGGDPAGNGTGDGPRTLTAEFSDKKHERGVLSMARSSSPNSASCQFFVMHGPAPGLDGQYSVFGKLVSGLDTLDKIANSKGTKIDQATVRPTDPQRIVKATVVRIAK